MKDTIVTAIYYHTPQTRIGGRGYVFQHYRAPFRNLLNLGCNIVVYSHESQIESIECFFQEYEFKDYLIIPYDLDNYRNSEHLYRLKEENGMIDANGLVAGKSQMLNDRNYHLCLSKPEFLKQAIQAKFFDSENYYWVDAGLFHHGIIPERFGGIERYTTPQEANYWPSLKTSVCNPGLLPLLRNKTENAPLLFLGIDGYYPATQWWSELTDSLKHTHIVGGLFGGTSESVLQMIAQFEAKIDQAFSKNILTLEEEILSIIYIDEYLHQPYLSFRAWYHDIPEERNYFGIEPGCQSFYKIFLD